MTKAWSILPDEWKPILLERGLRPFRAEQILHALYRDMITNWDNATTLPLDFRETLKREFPITKTDLLEVSESSDGTKKLLIGFEDGQSVETVLIPATGRFTQCLSTQVGCAMGCVFCASGSQGVARSLSADEIVAEYMLGRTFGEITNIVVMGMGEPFVNYDETMRALKLINAGKGPNLGARHITLSTCGVVPGIERLSCEGIQFELSVSLHAPNDELRSQLMPVNRRWPMDELLEACAAYTRKTKRAITFEYTVIAGINDSRSCAEELAMRLKKVPLAKVNLIPLSPVSHRPDFATPDERTLLMFLDVLMKNKIQTMLRRSRGKDADAACGQLRLRKMSAT
ncbi:MAG: 23S rRNA (adenine(2503)-C(2))-methyltransferase RlmN [Kiritimatiellae bacterium]|jgi:23S rRNA (adenine2503-C2)-methyltransferase|nr:23S rRNA (adenine(2503)-C(2))-methyltransferase RlmN [Kiritimatiellia bacterium]